MPRLPVRGAGAKGALPDLNPYDIPHNVPSDARNVRFVNGGISSFSVFKELQVPQRYTADPLMVFQRVSGDGSRRPNLVLSNGEIWQIEPGGPVAVQGLGWGATTGQCSVAALGGSYFLNNYNRAPAWRAPGAAEWAVLPNWPADNTAGVIRAFHDFLIALDVTKGTTHYHSMVKWSDAVQAGQAPLWDPAGGGTLAGENVLNDNPGRLVDALEMGNSLIIYGQEAVYRMDYIGTPLIFDTQKVFNEGGIIARNCVVEVDSKHYVFGKSDIYLHDGVSKVSLATSRVRRRIWSRLDYTESHRCFVAHSPLSAEIMFCYPSKGQAGIVLANTKGCNEAAVYNYRDDNWSFVDLPGATSITLASLPYLQTWDTTMTWEQAAASWIVFEGDPTEAPLLACAGTIGNGSSLQFLDQQIDGFLSNAESTEFAYDSMVEWTVRDFDDLGIAASHTKMVRAIYPQINVGVPEDYVMIQVGETHNLNAGTNYQPAGAFYPWTDVKFDCKVAAQYVSLRITAPSSAWFEMSGFDLDLLVLSQR